MKHYFRCLVGIVTVLMLSLLMGCSHHNAEEVENSKGTGRYEAKVVSVSGGGYVTTDATLLPNGKKPSILTRVYFNKFNLYPTVKVKQRFFASKVFSTLDRLNR